MDYAENASLISQDEIQSGHWNHTQVLLFTCFVWTVDNVYSYVVVSDEKDHSKYWTWVFFKVVLSEVGAVLKSLRKLYLFSDNCSAQFRSK